MTLTIKQILETYKHLHTSAPHFGMDIYSPSFVPKDIVLLHNSGGKSSGVPVRCDHYILILCLRGGSIRNVKQQEYKIDAHSLQLLPAGLIHSFIDSDDDSEFYVLLFEKEFLLQENIDTQKLEEMLYKFHENPSDALLDLPTFKTVVTLFEQLDSELKNEKSQYLLLSKMILTQLLFILEREKKSAHNTKLITRPQEIGTQFLCLIEQNFEYIKDVQSYAKMLDITPKHLSSTIKETLNASALSFIHSRVMKEIQYLLAYSDKSVAQISVYLNFENPSEMGRFFKKFEGITPKVYRQKNSKINTIPTNNH